MKYFYSSLNFLLLCLCLVALPAHAEAQLGDLIILLPVIVLTGIYEWLVKFYWWLFSATCAAWAWRLVTGSNPLSWLFGDETRDGILGTIYRRRASWIPLHFTLTIFLFIATLWIAIGFLFSAPKKLTTPVDSPAAVAKETAKNNAIALAEKAQSGSDSLPSPVVIEDALEPPINPAGGEWPTVPGYVLPLLPSQQMGGATIYIGTSSSRVPLYLKLCGFKSGRCEPVRHAYTTSSDGFIFKDLPDGAYELSYIETRGPPYHLGRSQIIVIRNGVANKTHWNLTHPKHRRNKESGDDFYAISVGAF